MAMHRVPTLIVGIGGIGCRIAANISDLLSDEARERIGIVGMDTNVNDLTAIAARGVRTIQTSDTRTVGEYLQHNPEHLPWFPLNHFTASKSLLNGAGQIRAVSRLGALAAEAKGAFLPIKQEIRRIRANRGDSSNGNLTVMIVGSITGGTGAGLFLQLPYYIRSLVQNESGLKNIIIRGMFLGPDFTVDVQPSRINQAAVRVNGYACLKELNALYMCQQKPEEISRLKVDFFTPTTEAEQRIISGTITDNWESLDNPDPGYTPGAMHDDADIITKSDLVVPYNYLYLLENDSPEGSLDETQLTNVEGLAARMVHTLMFTPVSNNALSVEDNMILQDAAQNGMNRYSSAGMNRLVYPCEQVREYVTLSTIRDLVQQEWMLIDDKFRSEVATARSNQKTDSKTVIPKLKDSYLKIFRAETNQQGALAKLAQEAFYYDQKNKPTSRAVLFFNALENHIDEIMESAPVKAAQEASKLKIQDMKKFSSAASEVDRVFDEMRKFVELAELLVAERPYSIANELFPPNWQSMRFRKKNSQETDNIYQLLHNVHPITARFLCYDLIRMMEEKIQELEEDFHSLNLKMLFETDFDPKAEGVNSPQDILEEMKNEKNVLLKLLKNDEARIEPLKAQLMSKVKKQATDTTSYIRDGLTLTVCKILLERLERLADNYTVFFGSIETMIAENSYRIAQLEEMVMPTGQTGVFCSPEAMKTVSAEYQMNADNDLPLETKTSIFESLFKVLSNDFDQENKVQTERQKAAYAARRAKTLKGIFQTAVVDTIRTSVIKNGSGIVDMNVYQALERQFELECPEEDDFTAYLRSLIGQAMQKATPMVVTSEQSRAETTATAYIAMHPDCAAVQMGEPHAGATQALFAPLATEQTGNVAPTVILDEDFSPYEITCFRARYKFSIEDLVKYAPTSANALAYHTRIRSLGRAPLRTGNPDEALTVINPHLDRYWHEEAYLPAIFKGERERNLMDVYKSFIYGLGYSLFSIVADDSTMDAGGNYRKFWFYNYSSEIRIRNGHIGLSYVELFSAIPHNYRIKKAILDLARREVSEMKGFLDAAELQEKFREDPLVNGLMKVTAAGDQQQNILDVFLEMRERMEGDAWSMLFTALLEVLWEYFAELYDRNERLVNLTVRAVLKELLESCSLAGRTDLTRGEFAMKKYTEDLLKKQYVSQ